MNNLYKKVGKFVVDSFHAANRNHEIPHFKRTVFWLLKLRPRADEALKIAAISHDIERAFRRKDMKEKRKKYPLASKKYYDPHEKRGAEIIGKFLKKQGADREMITRVKMLVSEHEEGGNKDQNLLKDADNISFFENNVSHFLPIRSGDEMAGQKVREKFDWMFGRITFDKAKKIALPMYKKAINRLESIK
ncbi:MAG: DUF4202 family protein [Patescibacteria group bacterium]